jgi:hypothetical protein
MNLAIFTNSSIIKKAFSSIENSKAAKLEFIPLKDLRKDIKAMRKKDLIYIDISTFDQKQANSILTFLSKQDNRIFGIIDPKNQIQDIAGLFFRGITDYIGKLLLKSNISLNRIKKAMEFGCDPDREDIIPKNEDYIFLDDWKSIKFGKEYTFTFLYIGIDNIDKIKQRYNADILVKLQNNLHNYLTNFFKPYNGKIWIWNNFSGLVLFPFDGKDIGAVYAGCRLFLNQKIIAIECMNINTVVTFRIVMHIGNTIYKKRGNTGNIISNTINSIFHLGIKFIKPENFNITKDVFIYLKNGLKDNFVPCGTFEGNEIYIFQI